MMMTTNNNYADAHKVLEELDSEGVKKQLGEAGVQYVRAAIDDLEEALKGRIVVPNPQSSLHDQNTNQTDSGDAGMDTGDSEDNLEVADFLPFFFKAARVKDEAALKAAEVAAYCKNSRTICHVPILAYDGSDDAVDWDKTLKKAQGAWETAETLKDKVATIKVCWNDERKVFKPPFKKSSINNLVSNRKVDQEKLLAYLKNKMLPLSDEEKDENGMTVGRVLQPDLKFVSTHPTDPFGYFELEDTDQIDKSSAVVVAGESGSGKSVFACQRSVDSGFVPVYCLVRSDHMKSKPPDTRQFVALNAFFQFLIDEVTTHTSDHMNSVRNGLYQLKFRLNQSRNKWARGVLKTLLEELTSENDYAEHWFAEGVWDNKSKPEKVAIVVDEATDIDLAEGLVATVRETMKEYKYLAQKAVLLVIVGVGLDAIRDKDAGYSGRLGTNPECSELVVMKHPDARCGEDLE